MALRNELLLLTFLTTVTVLFPGVLGGEFCTYYGSEVWCTYGCCDFDCCDVNVGLIVGMSVLGVLVVSCIIAVVCCCVRRRASYGQVITANTAPGVVVTTSQTTMSSSGQPMYPTGAYPPGVHAAPYPMGAQYPPPAQPAASAMAPPPYAQATGGQDNTGFDYKRFN